jgi:hypothetical protein
MKNDSVKLYETLQEWEVYLPTFLGVKESPGAFELGYCRLDDVPELACDFIEEQTRTIKDGLIPTFSEFHKKFTEPKPPKKLSRSEISEMGDSKYFKESRHREMWKTWRLKKESQVFLKKFENFEIEHKKWLEFKLNFKNSKDDYIKWLKNLIPAINQFFKKPIPVFIQQEEFMLHTYTTGVSGGGKSEMMKLLIHQIMTKQSESAIVLIDPHGDIASEIVKFKEFENNDRLVYFNPALSGEYGLYPVINPLYVESLNEDSADTTAQSLVEVFANILEGDTAFTSQMTTILKPCLELLILNGTCTLEDLQKFMSDADNEYYVQLGISSKNPVHRHFFKTVFGSKNYNSSKHGVYTKLLSLLNNKYFRNSVVGKDTVEFEKSIEEGKIILFNLSKGVVGKEASQSLGKFIISRLQSFALTRAKQPVKNRRPVHVFVDECQDFLNSSVGEILTGTRKFGLYLSMAQQTLGKRMNRELKDDLMTNAHLKITGSNNPSPTYKAISIDSGVEISQLERLNKFQFFITSRNGFKLPVWASSHLVGNKNNMPVESMKVLKKEQIEKYYRPLQDLEEVDNSLPTPTPHKPRLKKKKIIPTQKNLPQNVEMGEVDEL